MSSAVLTTGTFATAGDNANTLRGTAGNSGASGANAGTAGLFVVKYPNAAGLLSISGTQTSTGGFYYNTFNAAGTFSLVMS